MEVCSEKLPYATALPQGLLSPGNVKHLDDLLQQNAKVPFICQFHNVFLREAWEGVIKYCK